MKILKSFFLEKEQLEKLKKLSAKTKVPKTVYIREALELVLDKYENILRGRHKKKRRTMTKRRRPK